MLVDAATAPRDVFDRDFDVCVIGTGPAGMAVARTLVEAGHEVALMEGGGLFLTEESQDLYVEGSNVGLDYDGLDIARLRLFGGSSNHWAGKCRAFDPINFEALPHNPGSGWPIGPAELDPYRAAADAFLDLIPAADAPDLPLAQDTDRFRRVQFRYSDPVTQVGVKYRDEIEAAANVLCAVNANLVDLRLGEDGGRLEAALFRTYAEGDPGFEIRARLFCLCLGGLENPRLLLNCDRQRPQGLGNSTDAVGRYFCEHPHLRIGQVYFTQPVPAERFLAEPERIFAPTDAFLRESEILSFSVNLVPLVGPPLGFAEELVRSTACVTGVTENIAERVLGRPMRCERGGLAKYFAQEDGGRQVLQAALSLASEQSLIRDSRVMLDEARDGLGLRRISLDWRIGDLDYRTFETAVVSLGAHFAEQDEGRVLLDDWLLEDQVTMPGPGEGHRVGGHHHMCSTRMSDDPATGVVDRDCRVHDVENLYVGGSSVFATPGYVNPTYTIVQLALRLGDHLDGVLGAA